MVHVQTHIITQYSHCPYDPAAPPARLAITACPAAVAANLERFLSASAARQYEPVSEHSMVDESYLLLSPAQFPVQWLLFVQGPDSEVKGQAG